ncbi:prepilin-type N-terminal cleavage/methylation domain-containing protein [Clostridium sp. D2Q-14]|uniref:prepilin-type N-terminal cleavage/methylation domain-containing protein n=1 Tax=Anaeromonas gelatinilytica TaxID=2683194 RepID=UPI00193C3D5A|nr:prepilin-type N-terminal cleavage/methylation domain-containing protein [Anaeromonas gelatinilytica]MBS4536192.1 prepilin-type N-terminal cleavage/methylation domain-containing protein [Anaeromonas gelatinilytica]
MKSNNKGFTLIELLVSISLLSLIIISIFSFFLSNLNNFDKTENDIILHQNARSSIEFITDKVMESKGISKVWDDDRNDVSYNYQNGEEIFISAFLLDTCEYKSDNHIYNKSIFTINKLKDEDIKKIKFGWVNDKYINTYYHYVVQANMEVSFYIDKIKLQKLNSNSINIVLYFKKDDYVIEPVETNIYFRNSY